MKKLFGLLLILCLFSACLAEECDSTQKLVIDGLKGTSATASYYEKTDGEWVLLRQGTVYVGRNGMGKTREGDGKTPTGEYRVTGAFGIKEDPGTKLGYIRVTETTYACDEEGEYYNMIIDTAETGHSCKGERMYRVSPEYNYGITIDYNADNTYPLGSAIFLHCKGRKTSTSGCIAFDEDDLLFILQRAEEGMLVIISE